MRRQLVVGRSTTCRVTFSGIKVPIIHRKRKPRFDSCRTRIANGVQPAARRKAVCIFVNGRKLARTGPLRLRVSGTGAGAMRPGPAWEYRFAGGADARRSALQKCLQPFPRSRISSQIKNGPPSSAVRIPTGRRAGAIRIRAVISQTARNAAPKMMLPQNKTR
jgi:hypothetical protein